MPYTLNKRTPLLWSGLSPTGARLDLRKPENAPRDSRGYWNLEVNGQHLTAFSTIVQAKNYLAGMYGERVATLSPTDAERAEAERLEAAVRAEADRLQAISIRQQQVADEIDAEERRERDLLERVQSGSLAHSSIAGSTFVGTISQAEMARLVRMLGTYIADAPEQLVRISTDAYGHLHFMLGDSATQATIDITDSIVHIKEA